MKNQMKFLAVSILLISMVLSLAGCFGGGEKKVEDEYFVYTLLSDNTYSIAAKDKSNLPAELYIPQTFKGKLVTKIAEKGFSNCKGLEYVVLSDKITSIGNEAFARCTSLTHVEIPKSVTAIGKGAFGECTNLGYFEYLGTMEDWGKILKSGNWDVYIEKIYVINCFDGQIEK